MARYSEQQVSNWLSDMVTGVIDLTSDNMGLAKAALDLIGDGAPLPPGYLTDHFTLAEMIASQTADAQGIDNTPGPDHTEALTALCDVLEMIRSLCDDKPMIVSSGYRSSALNAAVGGASNSAHQYGCAADITVPDFGTPLQVAQVIAPHVRDFGIDQLIYESGGGAQWVHVGLPNPGAGPPRGQCFTITNGVVSSSPFPTAYAEA
jgi:hypothetical protein